MSQSEQKPWLRLVCGTSKGDNVHIDFSSPISFIASASYEDTALGKFINLYNKFTYRSLRRVNSVFSDFINFKWGQINLEHDWSGYALRFAENTNDKTTTITSIDLGTGKEEDYIQWKLEYLKKHTDTYVGKVVIGTSSLLLPSLEFIDSLDTPDIDPSLVASFLLHLNGIDEKGTWLYTVPPLRPITPDELNIVGNIVQPFSPLSVGVAQGLWDDIFNGDYELLPVDPKIVTKGEMFRVRDVSFPMTKRYIRNPETEGSGFLKLYKFTIALISIILAEGEKGNDTIYYIPVETNPIDTLDDKNKTIFIRNLVRVMKQHGEGKRIILSTSDLGLKEKITDSPWTEVVGDEIKKEIENGFVGLSEILSTPFPPFNPSPQP